MCEAGKPPAPDERHVCYPAGFEPGRLYELIYRAKDPTVGGLGFAATRDLGAFLRNSPQDDLRRAEPGLSRRQCRDCRGLVAERPHDPQFPRARLQCRRDRPPGVRRRLPSYRRGPDAAQCSLRAARARLGRADRPSLSRLRFSVLLCASERSFDPAHARPARPMPCDRYVPAHFPCRDRARNVGRPAIARIDRPARSTRRRRSSKRAHLHHGKHTTRRSALAARYSRAVRQLPAAAESRSAALDHARLAHRVDGLGAGRRSAA